MEFCEKGHEPEVHLESSRACGRTESTWASRQQQVKSSWEKEAACGSRGRSDGGTKQSGDDRGLWVPTWTVKNSREKSRDDGQRLQEEIGKRGARLRTKESVHHARKFGRICIRGAMSRTHVVVRGNGAIGADSGMSKENGSGTEGHSEGRSGPKTNEGVHGQSSRVTGEANEIDDCWGEQSTEDTWGNDGTDG